MLILSRNPVPGAWGLSLLALPLRLKCCRQRCQSSLPGLHPATLELSLPLHRHCLTCAQTDSTLLCGTVPSNAGAKWIHSPVTPSLTVRFNTASLYALVPQLQVTRVKVLSVKYSGPQLASLHSTFFSFRYYFGAAPLHT
jgi:hypothetical protein